jgi:hypothetical protein
MSSDVGELLVGEFYASNFFQSLPWVAIAKAAKAKSNKIQDQTQKFVAMKR